MTNEKFVYVFDLLQALNTWYNPGPGFADTPLSPHALLLDNDDSVREAVAKAVKMMENPNATTRQSKGCTTQSASAR